MATVRLIIYDFDDAELASADFSYPTLKDAITAAALAGMEFDFDFLVVEAIGNPPALYWSGRRAQKAARTEIRAILTDRGL